jgi:hypothetical protein
VKQEISRKMGYSIQAEEEQLRVQLEKTQLELNHPTQFKVEDLLKQNYLPYTVCVLKLVHLYFGALRVCRLISAFLNWRW